MDPDEGTTHGNTARSPRPPPLPYNTAPAMMLNPYENQSYLGFINSASPVPPPRPDESMKNPPITFKRLIVQIGCQNDGSNETEQKKRVPKILKAISDPNMTVEDWLYDLLISGDVANEELVNLFQHQNRIITVNYGTTSLLLSLGPNRSIPIQAIKSKKGLKCSKCPSTEETNGKKRGRKTRPKSLRIELVMSKSNVLLCPRDPIFQLIDSNEEYTLQSVGEGTWNGNGNEIDGDGDGDTIEAPEPVEEPPAKRQKLRQETQQQQKPAASTKKREKTKKQKKEDIDSKTNDDRKTKAKVDGSKSSNKEGQKSKKDIPQKSKAIVPTQEKTSKPKKTAVNKEKKKTPPFSEKDVLLGNGKQQRANKGNANYSKCIESKSLEYDKKRSQGRIEYDVKSSFTFYIKEEGSNSWHLLDSFSALLNSKIKRDLKNSLKRHKNKQKGNGTKVEEKPKAIKKGAVEVGTKKNTDDSNEDENNSKNGDGGSLSDETDRGEKMDQEDIGEKQTNEKDDEKNISAKTSEDQDPVSDPVSEQRDGDGESSNASSATSGSETENGVETENENEMEIENEDEKEIERKKKSPKKLRISENKEDSNDVPTKIVVENENRSNDTGALSNQKEIKNSSKLKISGRGDEIHSSSTNPERIVAESRTEGKGSDNDSNDDSSTSSDSSSASSSDSSSTGSSSVSSTSDDDSSSSDDGSSASEKEKASKASRAKQLQRPKNGAKKRKPLLDPKKPLLFPETKRRLSYDN